MSDRYRVACLGPAGTFSETAAQRWLHNNLEPGTGVWLAPTIAAAATAAATQVADHAVLPVHNTVAGAVADTHRALQRYPELRLVDHLQLSIELVLAAADGSLDEVSCVYSHPVAYRQVAHRVALLVPHAQVVPATSTSAAAAAAAQDRGCAAVCSPATAGFYGLTGCGGPLTPPGNTTTFHVFTGGGTYIDLAAA